MHPTWWDGISVSPSRFVFEVARGNATLVYGMLFNVYTRAVLAANPGRYLPQTNNSCQKKKGKRLLA